MIPSPVTTVKTDEAAFCCLCVSKLDRKDNGYAPRYESTIEQPQNKKLPGTDRSQAAQGDDHVELVGTIQRHTLLLAATMPHATPVGKDH
jgi:hypothetical protein